MLKAILRGIGQIGVISVALLGAANAQDFSGKTISIYVGTGPGTTYDSYARLLTEHMGEHLPGNPNMIVENMSGAGGTKLAGYLANVAPSDGTALAVPHQNLPLGQILTPGKANFDMAQFHWLGTITPVSSVLAVWHEAPGTTLEQARDTELFMGTTGRGSETYQVPSVMNNLFGTKFKLVTGYKSLGEMDKAIEQGELHGRGGSILSWTARQPEWIADGKIEYLVQIGLTKMKDLPEVPLLLDLAEDEDARNIIKLLSSAGAVGRSLISPPDVDEKTNAVLIEAFQTTMKDPDFLAAAEAQGLSVEPADAATIQSIVEETIGTPADLAEAFRTAVGF